MINLEKFRLPFREDTAFGLLALALFSVPLVFSAYSYENFESIKFCLFLILTGASAAVYFFKADPSGVALGYNKKFYWLLTAFFVWSVISALLAQDKLYSFLGFYYRYTSGVVFYAALLLFIVQLVNLVDAEKLEFLLKILVVDALAVSLISYLQSFSWIFYSGLDSGALFRGPSLLGNPNYSAMFLACIFPLTLYLFARAKQRSSQIYYLLSGFFIILANIMLGSRGALLAMAASVAAALILFFSFKFPKKFFLGLLAALLMTGALGYFVLKVSRPQAVALDVNAYSRFYAWEVSLKIMAQHPWFGSGPGNYALLFEHEHSVLGNGSFGVFDDAHNLFLQLGVTGGLPLVLFFIGLILLATLAGLADLRQGQNLLSLSLLASLAAWVIGAAFNPVPIPMFLLLGVLLVGLLLNHFSQKSHDLKVWQKLLLGLLGCLILAWGGVNLVSEHLLGQARQAYQNENYALAYNLAKLSARLNPSNALADSYQTGSAIYLAKPRTEIEKDIAIIQNLHPTQAESHVDASNLWALFYQSSRNKSDLEAAVSTMQAVINIDPLYAERYGQLGLYYYQLGDYQKAQINTQHDLNLNDSDFPAWILLAKLYQLKGNRAGVIAALTRAFKLNPNIPQLKYLLTVAKTVKDIRLVPIQIVARPPEI